MYDFCQSDPDCRCVLDRHSASRSDLEQLFWMLRAAGAGQWVGRHYVPVSVLMHPRLLDYALSHLESGDVHQNQEQLAADLIALVERGKFA